MKSFFALLLPLSICFYSAHAQTAHFGEQDANNMRGFARAVAVEDGSVFIGEPANAHQPGVVYIYRRSDGNWTQHAQLMASDGQIGDDFGSSLSVDGDRILIGAPEQANDRGAAYIFERSNDGSWKEVAKIAPSDENIEGELGASVALLGDLAFIGAPDEKDGLGAVYVYGRTKSGKWKQQTRLANPDASTGTSFGSALAVDGNRLLVGAPREQGGAVYAYSSDDKGSWTLEAMLTSGQVDNRDDFGQSLILHGDEVLIGAPDHAAGAGAVFVFRRHDDGSWSESGRLVAYDGGPRDNFGSSLAFVGRDVWIGAPEADNDRGALYQFERASDGMGWAGTKKLAGPEREQEDEFAGSFAVEGNVAVVGLTGADYGTGTAAILESEGNNGSWSVQKIVLGETGSVLQPITGNKVECFEGKADRFGCNNVDLISFLPINKIGGDRGVRLNDMWGWTDPKTGKEYALVGRNEGTSFVDVSDPFKPVYVGTLPKPEVAEASTWRDIKVYENHAFIVSDNAGEHGMQVVDLMELRAFEGTPITFEEAAHYSGIHSAHNIVINTDTGFAYIVGSSGGGNTCGGGLHMVNIQDPTNPTFAGCFADPSTGRSGTGYSHDAQCVTYHGPDEQYKEHEICIGANETAISIADVTDKKNPKAISAASYPDHAYIHQGWLTEDHRYYFQNDELDELNGNVDGTRTLVWDVTDLDDPQLAREFILDNQSTDHNLYIEGNTMYQSNYVSGLQVVDVSDPENPVKVGSFDTHPFGKDSPGFGGTWSNYPFFDSGIVVMTSSREGLFILQQKKQDL